MLDTNIKVKTENFDGPLGLLLLLIQKEEMDIRRLDISRITGQYLDYLNEMRELNFDVAGEYLYMAATLLLLKSRTCIDEKDEAFSQLVEDETLKITSRSELVSRLQELQHFQKMGQVLWSLPKRGSEIFTRPKIDRKVIVNSILTPIDLEKLISSMLTLIQREKRKFTVVEMEKISIRDKLQYFTSLLKEGQTVSFDDLLESDEESNLADRIISFISILELARLKKVAIFQNEEEGDLYLNVLESLEGLDIEAFDMAYDYDRPEEVDNISAPGPVSA